jgi:hypothetical protein
VATVTGASYSLGTLDVNAQIVAAGQSNTNTASTSDTASSVSAGALVDTVGGTASAGYSSVFDTVSGDTVSGSDTVGGQHSHHDTVGQSGDDTVSGFDTVTGPGHHTESSAGTESGSTGRVAATQKVHKGGVTLHLADGSSLTVAGVNHIGHSFFGHGH